MVEHLIDVGVPPGSDPSVHDGPEGDNGRFSRAGDDIDPIEPGRAIDAVTATQT